MPSIVDPLSELPVEVQLLIFQNIDERTCGMIYPVWHLYESVSINAFSYVYNRRLRPIARISNEARRRFNNYFLKLELYWTEPQHMVVSRLISYS